jgi:hypothetical protein
MNKPPINTLIALGFAVIGAYQPIVTVDTDKVTLSTTPAWGLILWAGVAVVLGLYGRKRREYIGPGLLLAFIPVINWYMLQFLTVPELRVGPVNVGFGQGSILAWAAAACVLSVAFGKDPEVPADDKEEPSK